MRRFAFLDNLLREGEQPIGIVGALAWLYRKLIEARGLPATMNGYQAARQLGHAPRRSGERVAPGASHSEKGIAGGAGGAGRGGQPLKSSNPNPRATMEFLVARLTVRSAA